MAQWAHYSEPDGDWNERIAKVGKTVLGSGPPKTIQELRTRMDRLYEHALATCDYPKTGLIVTTKTIPVNGGNIEIRTYVPETSSDTETFPVMATFHGGGFVFGDLNTDEIKCRRTCVTHRLSVVNVNYRHAPEYPFPTGLNDSYESLKWILVNAGSFKGDISKGFIICGLSAGSRFTCLMTQRARNDPVLKGKITAQILQYPSTLSYPRKGEKIPEELASQLLSLQNYGTEAVLDTSLRDLMTDAYKPPPLGHADNSPICADSFEDLPPAYAQVAGADVLRDEGLLYMKFLEEAGIPTKVDVYPGVPHGFSDIIPEAKASHKFQEDFDVGLKWLLSLRKN